MLITRLPEYQQKYIVMVQTYTERVVTLILSMKTNKNKQILARNKPKKKKTNGQDTYRLRVGIGHYYAPESVVVNLTYADLTLNRNNAGSKWNSWRIRMNSVYDPDPLLLTGAVSGFLEWSNFYRKYLVTHFTVDAEISNKDAFAVGITAAPTTADIIAALNTPAACQDLSETPLAIKAKTVSQAGGVDRIKISKTIDLAQFCGNRNAYLDSLQYASLISTNPAQMFYWNWGIFTDTNLANGLFQNTKYTYRVLFTDRISQFA
jgi:hypothetical protein